MTNTVEGGVPAHLDQEEVLAEIRNQVAAELGLNAETIGAETALRELPGADSVRLLRVVAKIERRYDIEFDDEDVFKVCTPGELAALVLRVSADGG